MEVGVGLPGVVPGAPPEMSIDWARRADNGPFGSVGLVDRLLYGNHDPLVTLAGAAAVTSRVRLVTSILIAPLHETLTLAKQTASLDALSGGRLTVGVATGARQDDYDASEMSYKGRGSRLSDQLAALREHWEGDALGPPTTRPEGPPVLVGGASGPAYARMARYGDGWIHQGGPPRAFANAADQARAAWADAGRTGEPQLWGMGYFAFGDELADRGRQYLLDYYAFVGSFAQKIADGLITSELSLREMVEGYADAGCDHLILFPAVAEDDQIDRLAEALPS